MAVTSQMVIALLIGNEEKLGRSAISFLSKLSVMSFTSGLGQAAACRLVPMKWNAMMASPAMTAGK